MYGYKCISNQKYSHLFFWFFMILSIFKWPVGPFHHFIDRFIFLASTLKCNHIFFRLSHLTITFSAYVEITSIHIKAIQINNLHKSLNIKLYSLIHLKCILVVTYEKCRHQQFPIFCFKFSLIFFNVLTIIANIRNFKEGKFQVWTKLL